MLLPRTPGESKLQAQPKRRPWTNGDVRTRIVIIPLIRSVSAPISLSFSPSLCVCLLSPHSFYDILASRLHLFFYCFAYFFLFLLLLSTQSFFLFHFNERNFFFFQMFCGVMVRRRWQRFSQLEYKYGWSNTHTHSLTIVVPSSPNCNNNAETHSHNVVHVWMRIA